MRLWLLLVLLLGCAQPPPEPIWSDRPVHLVGLGDSVTDGFGASPGRSYFEQLEKRLKTRFPHLESHNYAVSGTTSRDHLERQLPRVPARGPDVLGWVVITSGGNDLIHNYGRTPPRPDAMYGATFEQARPWLALYEPRLEQLLAGVKQRFPGGCRIFLANIYDPTEGKGDLENAGVGLPPWPEGLKLLADYNATLKRVCDEDPQVYPVDFHSAFMGHGIHHRGDYWYYANLEDPNDQGYDAITRLFLEAMEASVRENPPPSSK